jgi:hypothetical protein
VKINEVTTTVRYSAEAKGAWRSIEVGATASLGPDDNPDTAQNELYDWVASQVKASWSKGKIKGNAEHGISGPQVNGQHSAAQANGAGASQPDLDHFCQEHNQEFKKRTGRFGDFWSHQVNGTGQWCNEAKAR